MSVSVQAGKSDSRRIQNGGAKPPASTVQGSVTGRKSAIRLLPSPKPGSNNQVLETGKCFGNWKVVWKLPSDLKTGNVFETGIVIESGKCFETVIFLNRKVPSAENLESAIVDRTD